MDPTRTATALLLLSQGLERDVRQAASVATVSPSDLTVLWGGLQWSAEGQGNAAHWGRLAERQARVHHGHVPRPQVRTRYPDSLTRSALRVRESHVVISCAGDRWILLKE